MNRTVRGFSDLGANRKMAKKVRDRISEHPASTGLGNVLSYPDLKLLRQTAEDKMKIIQIMGFSILSKEPLMNAAFLVYAFGLPSTFISEEGRKKKISALENKRAQSAIEFLHTMEAKGKKGAAAASQLAIATSTLRAQSPRRAMKNLQSFTLIPSESDKGYKALNAINEKEERRKTKEKAKLQVCKNTGAGAAALLGICQPALKAGCKYIGTSNLWFQPGPLRRNALGQYLERLVEEDETLQGGRVSSLSHVQLVEACSDRGFLSLDHTDRELRKRLRSWLHLVKDHRHEPHRVRLAAMAACSTASMRQDKTSLVRLLYAP
jgi:hypothetical protein